MRAMRGPTVRWEPILVMIVVAGLLTWAQHRARDAGESSLPERAARAAVWPLQSALVRGGTYSRNIAVAAYRGRHLVEENEELRRRVQHLEAEKLRMVSYYHDNLAMRKKLGWPPLEAPPGIAARVIDWSSGLRRKRITVEANRELERGNIVRTSAGLVGRVIEAQGQRGTVMLLTDAESAVAARVERENGDLGMVYAAPEASRDGVMLKLVPHSHNADLRVGDMIVSSGDGGVYPKDLPVGVIERVETSAVNVASITAYVRPFADFEHLDYVLVERRGE
ncbi:MAG: rod shape-determining protein MreC [Armatimonadota bacterium]|jgi:rod shape-determining protein MreC